VSPSRRSRTAAALIAVAAGALVPLAARSAAAAGPTTVALTAPADLRAGSQTLEPFTADVHNGSGATQSTERLDVTLSGLSGLVAGDVLLQYETPANSGTYSTVKLTTESDGTLSGPAGPAGGAPLTDGSDRLTRLRLRVGAGAPTGLLTVTGRAVDASQAQATSYGSGATQTRVYRLPGAPTISAVTPRDASLAVAVSPPTDDGAAPITGYSVTAVPAGSGKPVTATSTSNTLTVSGLVNGTAYTLTAKARNQGGYGAPSGSVTATPVVPPLGLTLSGPVFVHLGTQVVYAGRLTRGGVPLAGVPVLHTESYVDGRSAGLGATPSRADGSFSFTNRPLYNGTVTASAAGVAVSSPSRVIIAFTGLTTSITGGAVNVAGSTVPGFITGPNRQERVQLLEVDSHGRQLRVLALVNAGARHSRPGYAQGLNDVRFRVRLSAGTHRLVVRVIGTPVNTGAPSKQLVVRV